MLSRYIIGPTLGSKHASRVTDFLTDKEPSVFNFLTKEGRSAYTEKIRKNPKKAFFKAVFDPTGLNPFI